MKHTHIFLPLILGLAIVSCAKNELSPEPSQKPADGPKMKVVMTSEETKTALEPAGGNDFTSKWTAGDKLGIFVRIHGIEDDVDNNIPSAALTADAVQATFEAEVTQPAEKSLYEFYTYYPYSNLENNNYKAVRVNIPDEQHPANASFDPKADILSGYPVEKDVEALQTELTGLSLKFVRKSSIVRFLIPQCKDFDGINGETPVEEVKVYFDKNVAGVANWNLIEPDDLTLEDKGATNVITLKYSDAHKVTDPLWLSIAPVSGVKKLTFAFKVADNAYLYAEASLGGGVSFEAGKMKKYDIPISGTKWELRSFSNKYVKVTETPDSWLGKYLIVGENDETLYACDQSGFGSWGNCSAVTAESDGSISSDTTIDGYAFEVVNGTADGTYAFKTQDNKYLSSGAVKNCNVEESQSATKTDFTLTCADDLVKVESNTKEGRYLRYNHNSGSGGLRFYDGTTGVGVSLYKKIEDYTEIVPVIANPEGIPDEIAKEGVTDATFTVGIANLSKYSVTIPTEGGVDGTVVTAASVSYAGGTATVTYSVAANTGADRDGWIKVQAGATEKKIDIHQATGIVLPEITPVADQNITYEASDSRTFDVTITNVGSYAVTCATDGTVVTSASAALKEGNVYTVTYTVTENKGETLRNGTVTVKCSTVSQVVNIKQSYNSSLIQTYILTELANIGPDDVVILIGNGKYAMSNDKGTSSAPSAVDLSNKISAGKIVGNIAENLLWNTSGNATDGYTFYPNGVTNKWLYCNTTAASGSNNNMRVGTGDRKSFVKDGDRIKTKDSNTDRYLDVYNDSDWRGYVKTSSLNTAVTFYVLDDGKQDSDLAWSAASKTLGLDDEVADMPVLSGHNASAATFSSSEPSVATVDASGNVTLVGVGSTVIKANVEADDTYRAGEAPYTLTVTAPVREFSATPVSFSGIAATGVTGQTVTVTASPKVVWSLLEDDGITVTSCTATKDGDNYKGSGVITFSVSENTGVERELLMLISTSDTYVETKDYEVVITQNGAVVAKSFNVTESGSQTAVAIGGSTETIHITGDSDVAWTASLTSGDSDAISFTGSGTGPANNSVVISANSGAARSFVITVSTNNELVPEASRTHVITYNQAGKEATIINVTPKTGLAVNAEYDVREMFKSNSDGAFTYSIKNSPAGASLAIDGYTFTATTAGTYTIVANQAATATHLAESAEGTITVAAAGGSFHFALDQATTGSTATGYVTTAKKFTVSEVDFYVNNWNPKNGQARGNQDKAGNNFELYNDSALPGGVKSIVITYSGSGSYDIVENKIFLATGSSKVTTHPTSGTTGTKDSTKKTLTFTLNSSNKYFYLGFTKGGTSGTVYITDVKITYGN